MPEATIFLIFSTSFVVALSGALAPGPLLVINIGESARRGPWTGSLLVAGHGVVELVMVIALTLGMGDLLKREDLGAAIGIAGGLVLLWMGVGLVRGAARRPSYVGAAPNRQHSMHPVTAGVVASVSNPYWLVWWATIGASYMAWSLRLGTPGIASFFSGHILADAAWYSLVSIIVAAGGRLTRGNWLQAVFAGCGILLIGLGIYFLISGTGFFLKHPGV